MMNMFVSNDFACGTAIYQEQVFTRKAHRAMRHTENKEHKAELMANQFINNTMAHVPVGDGMVKKA